MSHADDEAAFLQAIREAPDDDGPRLMFADWLEERGDERAARWAELIRAQCQRPRGNPLELPQRDYDLLLWARQHLVPAGMSPIFSRGFVEQVGCPLDTWLHGGPSLVAQHPVQWVWISDKRPELILRVYAEPGDDSFIGPLEVAEPPWAFLGDSPLDAVDELWTFLVAGQGEVGREPTQHTVLPPDFTLWQALLNGPHATEQEAKESLSEVCIAWARATQPVPLVMPPLSTSGAVAIKNDWS